eukprot:2200204-Amphidinium_carterae.3
MAKPAGYKPTHRLVSKQSPPVVAQLDEIEATKELALENNWDKEELNRMESLEDNVHDIELGGNKEINQMINKKSFTERPSNNRGREVNCRFCGKAFSQYINDKDVQTFAATPSGMATRLLLTISIVKGYVFYTTDVASAFLKTPIAEEVFVQPPKEFYHDRPSTLWAMKNTS